MKYTLRSTFLLIILALSSAGNAQIIPSPYEIGFHIGVGVYNGDLTSNPWDSYRTPGGFIGLSANRKLSNAFSLRGDLSYGHLHASDSNFSKREYKKQRNFGFRTSVTEISLRIVWNPIGENHSFVPYLFGGVGYDFLNVKRDYSKFNAEQFANNPQVLAGLAADSAQKLPTGLISFPVGVGIRHAISDRLSLCLETTYNIINTDYLDGFSQAVNPRIKDKYGTHTIGLIYSFAGKNLLACPRK